MKVLDAFSVPDNNLPAIMQTANQVGKKYRYGIKNIFFELNKSIFTMLHCTSSFGLKKSIVFCLLLCWLGSHADNPLKSKPKSKRAVNIKYIADHFPEQLTDPQKKNRKSLSQFGYNLSLLPFPLFPISEFINPAKFGIQSYGKPGKGESNGSLYTCNGGFMDFSHIRAALDWTVFLTFKILTDKKDFDLPHEGGSLKLHFKGLDKLTLDDIASMAQKIAFERLVWHEVASWHYHPPNYKVSEQQSTFTPEDTYSDFLGTVIGKNVALRILGKKEDLSYSQIATDEIKKNIASLHPLTTKKGSRQAYDIVDRFKQVQLPVDQRNNDIWWDSEIIFSDERYVFKRYMNIGPKIGPWLVPKSDQLGCPGDPKAKVFVVPQRTQTGDSFYNYYEFKIIPDSLLFYAKISKKQLHAPFESFSTRNMDQVVNHIGKEMEEFLHPGFDKRDSLDPVPHFKGAIKVMFK